MSEVSDSFPKGIGSEAGETDIRLEEKFLYSSPRPKTIKNSLGRMASVGVILATLGISEGHLQAQAWTPLTNVRAQGTNVLFDLTNINSGWSYTLTCSTNFGQDIQWLQPVPTWDATTTNAASNTNFIPTTYYPFFSFNTSDTATNGTIATPNMNNVGVFDSYSLVDIVNWYWNVGPNPQMARPAEGDTVSGVIPATIQLTDPLQCVYPEVLIGNGMGLGNGDVLYSGRVNDGNGTFYIDTTVVPDGNYTISGVVGLLLPEGFYYPWQPPQVVEWYAGVDVIVSNNVTPHVVGYAKNGTNIDVTITGLCPHSGGYFDPRSGQWSITGDTFVVVDRSNDLLNPNSTIMQWSMQPLANTGITNDYDMGKYGFTPTNLTQVISIVAPTNGLFIPDVVDYSTYQGPIPQFVNAQSGDVAAGDYNIQVALTNLWPTASLTLSVDGLSAGTSTNGSFIVPTYMFPNGPHTLDAQLTTPTPYPDYDGSSSVDYATTDTVLDNWSTTNSLAVNSAPFNATAEYGSYTAAFDTSVPEIVNYSIYDQSNNLVWNASITNTTAGTATFNWPFVDNNNNPVALSDDYNSVSFNTYVSTMDLTQGSIHPKDKNPPIPLPLTITNDPKAGDTAVFRNLHTPGYEQPPLNLGAKDDDILGGIAGAVSLAEIIYPQDPWGGDRDMYPYFKGTGGMSGERILLPVASDKDAAPIVNMLMNTNGAVLDNQFTYKTHGTVGGFGPDSHTDADDWLITNETFGGKLHNYNVLSGVGHSAAYVFKYGHRIREADFAACFCGAGDLHEYCGSPDNQTGMGQSAFIGWASKAWDYPVSFAPTPYEVVEAAWQPEWTNEGFSTGPTVKRSNQDAVVGASGLFGLLGLAWEGPAIYHFYQGRMNGIHGALDMRWQMLQ